MTSTRFSRRAHSRNCRGCRTRPNLRSFMLRPQGRTERGGALVSEPDTSRRPSVPPPWCSAPAASPCIRHPGQCESDLFGGVQHDKDRRLFHRREHIGEESAFRKIPVGFLHFLGLGVSHSTPGAIRAAHRASADCEAGRRRRRAVMWPTKSVRSSPGLPRLSQPPVGLVVLAIGVVVAVLRIPTSRRRQHQRCPQREEQAGELVLAELPPQRNDRGVMVGPSWPQLLLWLSLEPSRLSRRWPRCASRYS